MAKCVVCGKHGLFLKVNAQGKCAECVKKEEKEEEERFEAYYAESLNQLQYVKENIQVDDPIEALEILPEIQKKIEVCDTLKAEMHDPKNEKRFIEKLLSNITYQDEYFKDHGIGELENWGISVFADPLTHQYSPEKIFSDIEKKLEDYKRQWNSGANSIISSAEFQKKIEAIPSVDIVLTNTQHEKKTVSDLDTMVKYTNITAKSNFSQIGNFVVVDTETTGLSSTADDLLEIAAIKFEDWAPVEKFHTLLNPGKHIPDEVTEINNITDEMVATAPSFSQVIDSLDSFIGSSSIVGHNLPFDLNFLYHHGFNFTTQKKRHYYDTCEIAKKTLKKAKMKWDRYICDYVINDIYDYDVEDYKLTTLCDYYKIRDNTFAHRASSDALATGLLFRKLAEKKIDY